MVEVHARDIIVQSTSTRVTFFVMITYVIYCNICTIYTVMFIQAIFWHSLVCNKIISNV